MLCYDRIDFFEGINVNKTNKSKECVTIGIFEIRGLIFNHMSAMVVIMY